MDLEKNQIATGDYEAPVITLSLDDDSELDCALIAVFDGVEGYEDIQYGAFLPTEPIEGSEDGELYFFRYQELDDDEVDVQNIETDVEFESVAERFDDLLAEQDVDSFEIQSEE